MKKGIISIVLTAIMAASLGACGDKEEVPRYGLVTDSEGIGTDSVNAEIWAAIQEYAGTDYLYKYYTAKEDTKKGLDEQFDTAAKDGTELVFACGKSLETAVFRAQRAHHKIRYVLVDGEPRKKEGGEVSFRENTTVLACANQDEGFIAGYGAVKNGYRNLAIITGEDNAENDRYLSGYVQGAEQAATELNLGNGEVKMTAVISDDDELTPLRMTDALILYKSGADVIYAVGKNIATAVIKASQSVSKPFIAGGVDMNSDSASCIFSTVSLYRPMIDAAIDDFESEEGLPAGEVVYYGAADKAVRIIADYTRLSTFTETDYNTIVRQMIEGTITVSGEKVTEGTAHVALTLTEPPSGLDESFASPFPDTTVAGNAAAETAAGDSAGTGDTSAADTAEGETGDGEAEEENTEEEGDTEEEENTEDNAEGGETEAEGTEEPAA